MSIFTYIQINGTNIIRPNDFAPQKEQVYAGEITTHSGKTIADLIGWRWSDLEMKWDILPQSQMRFLAGLSGENTITFTDAVGESHTEKFRLISHVSTNTRVTRPDGSQIWKDVTLSISFIETHR